MWRACEHPCVRLKRGRAGFMASPASPGLPGRLEGALSTGPQVLGMHAKVAQPLEAAREAGVRDGGVGGFRSQRYHPQPRLWVQSQGLRMGTI